MAPKDFLIPQVDLTTLRGPELRSLLDAARNRGQADLSYQILQEMAARRDGAKPKTGMLKGKRASEPHLVTLNFGDPLARDDEEEELPPWTPPHAVEAESVADPEPEPEPEPPLRMEFSQDRAPPKAKARAAKPPMAEEPMRPAPPAKGRRSSRLGLGLAIGVATGMGLGWWLSDVTRDAPRPSVTQVAAITPALPPAPPPLEAPVPQNVPELNAIPTPAARPPAPAAAEAPSPPAVAEPPKPPPEAAEAAPAETTRAETATTTEEASAGAAACSKATPADRAICDDPHLQRLQTELRQAYAEALSVHQDRATLRERQLAWRDTRNDVSDPEKLARLYEARIRTLKAATADARRQK